MQKLIFPLLFKIFKMLRSLKTFEYILGKGDVDRYLKEIKDLSKKYCLDGFYQDITDKERSMIVKAMGMAQGHWFKCPKGKDVRAHDQRCYT